jgi:hypothetical protein
MKKSYADAILGLYSGIFEDIRVNLPTVGGLERDENRLLSTVRTRGMRYLTIDMPAYGKHFDRCLAEGRLTPSHLPNFGWVAKGTRSHRFLGGLMLRVFDHDGLLLSQPCTYTILALRQLFVAAKKIKVDCKESIREQSLKDYLWQESSIRPPSLVWHGDRFDARRSNRLHIDDVYDGDCLGTPDLFEDGHLDATFCDTVHSVADRVFSSFGSFDPMEWRPKHGRGSVADARRGTFKYAFPFWPARLEEVFPYADLAFANYGEWADTLANGKVASSKEFPSVALAVPKTQVTPRIIAKESIANMWCQQIVRDYLEAGVRSSPLKNCISFRDQSLNQKAALQASLTQSHWTVDLSSASDRMSLWLVERLCRSNQSLLKALWASRSAYCEVRLAEGVSLLKMKKFAPQGSATTFPLQSIIYSILAISSVIYCRGWDVSSESITRASKDVRVFGDDSIIPDDCGRQYVSLLTYCGFLVNQSKTYGTGKFRESCGVEAYGGEDVTPSYITHPYDESDPTSADSTVGCSNNFFKKGFWHAAAALESTLPFWMRNHLRTGGPEDGHFGLTSYCGRRNTSITRWNEQLQREECLSLALTSKVERTQPGGTGHLLQYFTETPTSDIHWMSGVNGRPASKVGKRWEPLLAVS